MKIITDLRNDRGKRITRYSMVFFICDKDENKPIGLPFYFVPIESFYTIIADIPVRIFRFTLVFLVFGVWFEWRKRVRAEMIKDNSSF